jgi:hypothetical protein
VLKALEERLATTAKTQSFQIALLHHHPIQHEDLGLGAEDLLENGSRLVDILDDHDFDLIIHGHKHHPKLSYAPGGATTVPVFAAGSFSATNSKGLTTVTRNLFHLITLRKDSSSAGCLGRIQSWEWHLGEGWITPNFTSAHFPAVTGFGYRGSVDDLADKLTGWFRSTGSETKHWSEAVSAFPEIEDLIPRDFRSLGERLSNTHKLTLAPSPPDQPTFIGRVK